MTQDEFRQSLNAANHDYRLLFVTDGSRIGIAVGYDSGADEVILHRSDERIPLANARVVTEH